MYRRTVLCIAALKRVVAVIDALVPDATPRQEKRIASKIPTLCDGKDRSLRITQDQARDLILAHLQQCIAKECPLLCFWEPISRSLNMFFNKEE